MVESNESGLTVGCVSVAGGCGHLRYTLKSGDHVTEFAIDADSGVLTVTKPFDRGVKSFYNLVIGVEDETKDGHYTPPRSATSMVIAAGCLLILLRFYVHPRITIGANNG